MDPLALIAASGPRASYRSLKSFTATIRDLRKRRPKRNLFIWNRLWRHGERSEAVHLAETVG